VVAGVAQRLPVGKRLGGYLGQTRIRYPMPLNDDPVVGRRLPPSGANHALLRGLGWQLHRYAGVSAPVADRSDLGLPDWVGGPYRLPVDPDGRLDPSRIYLIRPDGFVAAAARPDDPATLHAALQFHGLAGR
jgi:hypothetical protein